VNRPGSQAVPFAIELGLFSSSAIEVQRECGGYACVPISDDGEELGQYIVAPATQEHAEALFDLLVATMTRYGEENPGAIVAIHDPCEYEGDDDPAAVVRGRRAAAAPPVPRL
jgi:hypothetical protein